MAQTPEGKVKARVVLLLKKHNVYHFYANTHGFGRSGVPDLICCLKGVFIGIECKTVGNKPTALQVNEIESIRNHGGIAWVVNEENIDLLDMALKKLNMGKSAYDTIMCGEPQ
jgi:hypothetical protein